MSSLFTNPFPFIESQQELDKLLSLYPQFDSYYVASGAIRDRHDKFVSLYGRYKDYADTHFLTEIKKRFHQRTWEMYVWCSLLDNGTVFSSTDKGPDMLIEFEGKRIWIECVACEIGEGPDQVPRMQYGIAQSVPTNEILIRLASVLKSKHEKYKAYLSKGIVNEGDCFIIAVNAGATGYMDGPYPYILRCTLAVGHPTISWPKGQGGQGPGTPGISTIPFIEKKNGSKVPMTFLLDRANCGISAVLYSNNTVLNHPEKLGSDMMLVHNHLAAQPLPDRILNFLKSYKIDGDGNLHL